MNSDSKVISSIRLFRTAPHPCSYKSEQLATTIFVDPDLEITRALNSRLTELGYRRSGAHIYRPDCEACQACISCRVPVADFSFTRSQNRIRNRNADLRIEESTTLDHDHSFELYRKYINIRHRDGDMFPATREQFAAFINTLAEGTRCFNFYSGDKLVAACVTDFLEHGLSAVYTFFDPDLTRRSLGKFVILWQIQQARQLGLPYVYLGYWIKDCQKMSYKSDYRPIEMLVKGKWVRLA